jgi:hypothetical protein
MSRERVALGILILLGLVVIVTIAFGYVYNA